MLTKTVKIFAIGLIAFSCKNINGDVKYCGFSFKKLNPSSDCTDGLEITANYRKNQLNSLEYKHNNVCIKQDTLMYHNEIPFFFSKTRFQLNKLLRISTRILDTSRTFILKKGNSNYVIAFIESYLSDSSIRIQFPWKRKIRPVKFNSRLLDSLAHYYKYESLFNESLKVNYHYSKGMLYFKIIEDYGSWQGQGPDYDSIINNTGNIYLDIEAVEDKRILGYQ
ncbi:hypothetical protein [Chitinophaga sp. GbtcB8]|uniref:hypothetical protein n=1 Tax=Chitinophaga sp. GbtcB8 TaxID=2824753 RepID=UPI001C2F6271|nr:hypothetical protein [Chitinophaga sp. GbtcB8]